jgi:hypothetical protein
MYLLPSRSPSNLGRLGRASRFASMRPVGTAPRRRRGLRGLGAESVLDILSNPVGAAAGSIADTYNAYVASSEAQANPANAPMASVPQLDSAVAMAKANGVDPALIQSLWMAGADSVQLTLAASGSQDAAQMLLVQTGPTPPAGQPVTDSGLWPITPVQEGYGPLSPDQVSSAADAATAAEDAAAAVGAGAGATASWLGSNWGWLALGGLGVVFLLRDF